jgi:hypothetical protein
MARTATALAAVTLALILTGSSSPASTSGDNQAGSSAAVTTAAVTTPASDGGGGSVDCTALTGDAGATYTVGLQLLAQMRSQAAVDSMKSSGVTYDPDAMGTILTKLKSLAGHGVLGDPGADVDFYLSANERARAILALDGPVPQAMFDDLSAFEGAIGAFLGRQVSISAAYSEACG